MKKIKIYSCIIFLLYFYLCNNYCYGQKNVIDSLKTALNLAKEDTGKINILLSLAFNLRTINPDTTIYYSNKALKLSEKLQFKIGIAEAYLNWGTACTVLGKYAESLKLLSKSQKLSEQLSFVSNETNKRNKTNLGRVYSITGMNYYQQGDFLTAQNWHNKAFKVWKIIGNEKGIVSCYINIGNILLDQGNYPEALNNYFSALKILEKLNDRKGTAPCYNNIGSIYYNQGNYSEALKNYFKALKIHKETGSKDGEAYTYGTIAALYIDQKKISEALDISEKELKVYNEIGSEVGIASSNIVIGKVKYMQGFYDEALNNFIKAEEIFEKIGAKLSSIDAFIGIGRIYQKKGDNLKAIDYAKKAISIGKETGAFIGQIDGSFILFEVYKKMGKYKDALEMHELYIQSRDSVINEKNQKDIMSQQFKFDYDKKALADSLNFVSQKNISDLKNKAEHNIEQNKRYALYAGLFLVLIFSLFIFNRFRITAKQKKIIEYQNSQIVESINYSKQIQASLLPSLSVMQKSLTNLFILYEPKAIVSGDFYWFKDFEKYTILTCVDCTGHGVPGGFMSTLGSLLLDKVVNSDRLNPSEILSNLSDEIIKVLHQQAGGAIQDGMDLSICLIDKEHRTVEFAGARNGIIVVTNEVAKKYKADLYPVGGSYLKKGKEIDRVFKTQKIALEKNDWIYMYTDGFMEQSGGEHNLPMNYSQFENHLIAISNYLSPEEKIQKLKQELDAWRGANERDDDVLLMGFQIN